MPDTMDGRLEMILLHVVLVLDRLKREGPAGQRLGQRLLECLVADLDDALRQIGLGDDSVSGRIQKLAGALRERAQDYGFALDAASRASADDTVATAAQPDMLTASLVEHVYRPASAPAAQVAAVQAAKLGTYVQHCRRALEEISGPDVLAARLQLPLPGA
ncbi:MAG: ubiquinol-cytochrome C chaperone family protein [Hyphomicrobiaceae bacterium]|nr:ubiquinol-cytochrome C chaperone family protein [Hyphomicrobiaceae bacterium]